MIQHVVVFRFKGDTPTERGAHADVAAQNLEAMFGSVPGMSSLAVARDLGDDSAHWDMSLISVHDSRAALRAYIAHPLHVAAKNVIDGIVVARAIVDSELVSAQSSKEAAQ